MKTIVLANVKGGVGKTTFGAILLNQLAAKGQAVAVRDGDAQQSLSKIVDIIEGETEWRRSPESEADFLIWDTRGAGGSVQVQSADVVVVPTVIAPTDLETTFEAFDQLKDVASKLLVLPNRVNWAPSIHRNKGLKWPSSAAHLIREEREGIEFLQEAMEEGKIDGILPPLSHRTFVLHLAHEKNPFLTNGTKISSSHANFLTEMDQIFASLMRFLGVDLS